MFIVLLILIFFNTSSCQVCRTSMLQVREVPETYHYTYYEAYQGADCLIWCTKSRLVTKTGMRMVQKMFNEFVDECCDGYVQNKTNSINCQPTCDPPCDNSICLHPNQCTCNPGYVIDTNNRNTCIPQQPSNDSNNSNCSVTPNCEDTVKSDSLSDTTKTFATKEDSDCPLHVKEQCCNNIHIIKHDSENENVDSYYSNNTATNNSEAANKENSTSNSNDSEMIVGRGDPFDYYESPPDPFCTDVCNNCKCIADEIWVCESGWFFNEDKTECLPHCDACVHGVCKAPNICECFEGYHLSKFSAVHCIPDCNCPEGCLIPNVCMNNSRCEKCENECPNEVVNAPNAGIVTPSVIEERAIRKPTSSFEDNTNFEEPLEIDIVSQKMFKDNQNKTGTKLSGIPTYWVYIAAAIGLLFLIVLIFLIKNKIKSKFGNTRKFSFVGDAADKNNMTVHYTTTH